MEREFLHIRLCTVINVTIRMFSLKPHFLSTCNNVILGSQAVVLGIRLNAKVIGLGFAEPGLGFVPGSCW